MTRYKFPEVDRWDSSTEASKIPLKHISPTLHISRSRKRMRWWDNSSWRYRLLSSLCRTPHWVPTHVYHLIIQAVPCSRSLSSLQLSYRSLGWSNTCWLPAQSKANCQISTDTTWRQECRCHQRRQWRRKPQQWSSPRQQNWLEEGRYLRLWYWINILLISFEVSRGELNFW